MKHVFQTHMGQELDKTYVGHKWGVGGMHGVCQSCQPGWRGIKRAIGLTGSPGGEHQTRRAIPSPLHLPDTRRRFGEQMQRGGWGGSWWGGWGGFEWRVLARARRLASVCPRHLPLRLLCSIFTSSLPGMKSNPQHPFPPILSFPLNYNLSQKYLGKN